MHAGKYVQQQRFPWYYGDNIDSKHFYRHNSVVAATMDRRVNAFPPSVAERTLIDAIDFPARERPTETRIFQGLVYPSECTDGDYLFRITSTDAAHLLLRNRVQAIIDNGGVHDARSTTVKVNLKTRRPMNFEVTHCMKQYLGCSETTACAWILCTDTGALLSQRV